jgi:hypothetical protein
MSEVEPQCPYYASRKGWLMWLFDRAAKRIRPVMVRRYGSLVADGVATEARQVYEALIPQLPFLGGAGNFDTVLIVAAAMFLAFYRPLKSRGTAVEEIGDVIHEAVEAFFSKIPRFLARLYGRLHFTRHARRQAQKTALESQQRQYAGDWVFAFVEGDGDAFDWGQDFVECGVVKFFRTQDAVEFAPHMCRLDFVFSDAFGWGLARTKTLARGDEKCDFRFKRKRDEFPRQG